MGKTIKMGMGSVLFFREYKKVATEDGSRLAFQVEHGVDYGKDVEKLKTKDGIIPTVTDGENTLEVTSYAYDEDDGSIPLWKELRDMFMNNKKVEVWEVDTDSEEDGEYTVRYFRGIFESVSEPKPAEGAIELGFTYAIEGNGIEGKDTLSRAQQDLLDNTLYEYTSIQHTGSGE